MSDSALDTILGIGAVASDMFKNIAILDENQANRIHQENLSNNLEDKRHHNNIELQNLKHEQKLVNGMFEENNKIIGSHLSEANSHNLLRNDIINLETMLDGKYATGSQSMELLNDLGVTIRDDLSFSFKTGTSINDHKAGLNEAINVQNDIVNHITGRLNEVDKVLGFIDEIDATAGINILDDLSDVTDYEAYIQKHPELFGYAGYSYRDPSVTGELPIARADMFMPSASSAEYTYDENGEFTGFNVTNQEQFDKEQVMYTDKEYIRKAFINQAPDISKQLSNGAAWGRYKAEKGWTDANGVEHKSLLELEQDAAMAIEIEERQKAIQDLFDEAEAAEMSNYEEMLTSYIGNLQGMEKANIVAGVAGTGNEWMNAFTNVKNFSNQVAKVDIHKSPDLAIQMEVDLVNAIGEMILFGLDEDVVGPFTDSSGDTNYHIWKLFGATDKELGRSADGTMAWNEWSDFGETAARNAWNNMGTQERRDLVYRFKLMTTPTAQEEENGNFSTTSLGSNDLNKISSDYGLTLDKELPFAKNSDGVYVTNHYTPEYDNFFVNAGIPWKKVDNISSESVGEYKRVLAYDAGGNEIPYQINGQLNPDAVKFDGVRKSRQGDGDQYWQPIHRIMLEHSDFKYNSYGNDIKTEHWFDSGSSIVTEGQQAMTYMVQAMELWDLLSKKENTMTKNFSDHYNEDLDYVNQSGLDYKWLFVDNPSVR